MMYFVIAAMKGEPGRPAGAGWAGGSGGRGGGRAGGGVGAPAPAHVLPGAGRRSPARAFRANAAAPPEPGPAICLLRLGAKAHGLEPPSSAPSGSCQLPGSAWHLAGFTKETLRAVAALLEGRGGSGKLGGSGGRPRPVPKARTPDSSGLRREGSAAGPGRAVRARGRDVIPGDRSAPQALRPPALAAQQSRAAARGGSAAGPRRVLPQPLPKVPGPERDGLPARAKAHPSAAARSRSRSPPRLDTLACGFAGSGGVRWR